MKRRATKLKAAEDRKEDRKEDREEDREEDRTVKR